MEAVDFCFEHYSFPKQALPYAREICEAAITNITKIDSRITCSSEHWSISRMGRPDRAILRLAISEMFYLNGIPVSVAINEAVEIAKRFGSEESPMFVNGVLDRAATSLKTQIEVSKTEIAAKDETELPVAAIISPDLEKDA